MYERIEKNTIVLKWASYNQQMEFKNLCMVYKATSIFLLKVHYLSRCFWVFKNTFAEEAC